MLDIYPCEPYKSNYVDWEDVLGGHILKLTSAEWRRVERVLSILYEKWIVEDNPEDHYEWICYKAEIRDPAGIAVLEYTCNGDDGVESVLICDRVKFRTMINHVLNCRVTVTEVMDTFLYKNC